MFPLALVQAAAAAAVGPHFLLLAATASAYWHDTIPGMYVCTYMYVPGMYFKIRRKLPFKYAFCRQLFSTISFKRGKTCPIPVR